MRPTQTSLALSLLLTLQTLPALAADPSQASAPPLDLAPLVTPEAPWLSKKVKRAPLAEAPPSPKPSAAKPSAAKPAAASAVAARKKHKTKPSAGVAAQEPALELSPLIPMAPAVVIPAVRPPPASTAAVLPAPPLLKLSTQLGVLVQADSAQTALEAGLLSIAALAPLSQHPRLVPRPAQRCGDDACASELGKALDELVVASFQAGELRLRVLDIASGQRLGDPQQATVKDVEAVAAAEFLACRVLVPAGCTGELKLSAAPGTSVELDGAVAKPGLSRLPVGLHALVVRSGVRSTARTISIVHESPLSLSLPETAERSRAAPVAVVAETSAFDQPPKRPPGRSWNKPAGIAVASAGAVAAGFGIYFGARSRSDLGSAEAAYHSNGGSYRTGDVATLNSGNSSARTANLLFAASAVLAGAGALLVFAF